MVTPPPNTHTHYSLLKGRYFFRAFPVLGTVLSTVHHLTYNNPKRQVLLLFPFYR